LHGNPSRVSPVGDELVGESKAIKSLYEVSQEDVGSNRFIQGGASFPKYQLNACRLGNKALEGEEVAGNRSQEQYNFDFSTHEPLINLAVE
jgi:hypothetical protein